LEFFKSFTSVLSIHNFNWISGPDGTGLQIDNDVDIRHFDNSEIAMRLNTDLKSGDEFFTDLNGFQEPYSQNFFFLPLQIMDRIS